MNAYDLSTFENGLCALSIPLTQEQKEQFLAYYDLLVEWNSFMNLTAITEFQEVVVKHFLDSLSLVKVLDLHQVQRLIDVGTGAGFPGIPLKIAFPHLEVTLLDSLKKRISFLETVIHSLGLERIEAVHGRSEDFGKNPAYREQYDLCVSRAVANLTTLSEYCLPFVKTGGKFISYKSGKIKEELEGASHAVKLLGGSLEGQEQFCLPGTEIERSFVILKKEKATPKKYPRKAGLPAKEPLLPPFSAQG